MSDRHSDSFEREHAFRALLEAVLLFHDGAPWTRAKHLDWFLKTGQSAVTTKALCGAIREALDAGATLCKH